MNPRVFLAAVGDVNSPVTWSGIPFHFLQAGKQAGLIDEGLALSAAGWRWKMRRAGWNAASVIRGDRYGGYQYSPGFLERLWDRDRDRVRGSVVINCFQLLPRQALEDPFMEKWFFIDQTLLQLFDFYGNRSAIGKGIAREAIEREREGYLRAKGVIVHSKWAARSVIRDYGVDPANVHVAAPGASIDVREYERWETAEMKRRIGSPACEANTLRLVFVGKSWRRKGLDRLLDAFDLALRAGLRGNLRVIGFPRESAPSRYRSIKDVEWLGFLDKRKDTAAFIQAVAECHLGCLLSRAEAGGIAFREYHALGLGVLGTDVGGAPEHMIADASVIVSAEAGSEEIASEMLALQNDPLRLATMRRAAWDRRRTALWSECIKELFAFWPHRSD